MICRFIGALALSAAIATSAAAQEPSMLDSARLTVGVPAYVHHPKERGGGREWNDGWFENEGVLADLSWPVYPLGEATNIRAGVTAGAFDNSIFDTSIFLGGMGEIEHFATERLSLGLGAYAGAVTGYDNTVSPGFAPYAGAAYAVAENWELGLRGYWMPTETLAGSDRSPSDAYIAAFTVGTRF